MGKKIVKVLDDFYHKDFKEGDMVRLIEGNVKIVDRNYQNENGTFILCEYADIAENEHPAERDHGKPAHPDNRYEVVGTIDIPGCRNLMAGPGFFVKDRQNGGRVEGLSFRQAYWSIFREGAANAEASESKDGMFHSKLIDTIDGLPSFDSAYWKIPAYDSTGKPFARLTLEASAEIFKAMKYVVRSRVRNQKQTIKIEDADFSNLDAAAELIRSAERIVVLAGAGLSTGSGIPDYRSSAEGLWRKHPSMLTDLNQSGFENHPENFWNSFYQLIEHSLEPLVPFPAGVSLLAAMEAIEPNDGHRFFSWLETAMGKSVTVITQNVDHLERLAGSRNVIEIHGNIHECICPKCQRTYPLSHVLWKGRTPKCVCQTVLRPNVVFFGDQVHGFKEAEDAVQTADLLLIVGTSLEVSPFNLLPHSKNSAKTVFINGTSSSNSFDYTLKGEIGTICRDLKEQLSAGTKS